jgi:DNA-binding response OmpR family regulator
MPHPHLNGASILVVEDEPLIVMDISMALEATGAHLTTTNTLRHARTLVEHDGLSAAMLDNALPDGDGASLCTRLTERGIPFLLYCGSNWTLQGRVVSLEARNPRAIARCNGSPDWRWPHRRVGRLALCGFR